MSEDLPYLYSKVVGVAKDVIRSGHTGPHSTGESLAGVLAAGDTKTLLEPGYSFEDAVEPIEWPWSAGVFSVEDAQAVWNYKLRLAKRSNA